MLYFISFHGCGMVVGAMVIPWLFHGFDMVLTWLCGRDHHVICLTLSY